jgi:hypothetical protein
MLIKTNIDDHHQAAITKQPVPRQRNNSIKQLTNHSQYEQMLVAVSTTAGPNEFKHCVPCTARRIETVVNSSSTANGSQMTATEFQNTSPVGHSHTVLKTSSHMDTDKFITEARIDGLIEHVNTNANKMSSRTQRDLKQLVGHNLKDFVHFNDQQLMDKHLNDVLHKYENTSSVYRFKLNDNKYAFVQTKSKLIKHKTKEFIHSLHSIIRDIDTELELKGLCQPPICPV